ncbi:MutS-related protein [Tepidibacter sp. Z1-5]|uniref:MutS-related protein n=1 Tax=Tepidibacter sp. Z1-5 TaxID=3134138 RepID=UPI0030BD9E75
MNVINYFILKIKEKFSRKNINPYDFKRKRNFNNLKTFDNNFGSDKTRINDNTWNDLNMDDVFCNIDYTITTPGEQVLYNILKNPLFDKAYLIQRGKYINYFQNNSHKKEEVIKILNSIGRTSKDTTSILCKNINPNPKLKWLVHILPVLLFINMIIICFIKIKLYIYSLIIIGFINIYTHYNISYLIMEQIEVIQYLGHTISFSYKLGNILDTELQGYSDELKKLYSICRIISRKTSIVFKIEGIDIVADYINILFLIKERNYFKLADDIKKFKNDIVRLYMIIGEIDSFVSIGEYRENVNLFSEPVFKNENKVLNMSQVYHPLLHRPIKNSFDVKNTSIIITGSNMSGKSTFMRTIGVNSIFAQTIYTCLADKYETSFYKVISSISLNDSLINGKSYYLCEAEAIKRIVHECTGKYSCLAIIDEIFSGTNPIERVGAAIEILNYLDTKNSIIIASTHDLELTNMLVNYEPYYFKEDVTKDGLKFDYKIRSGVSNTRNAIKILDYLGYPKDLILRINKRVGDRV